MRPYYQDASVTIYHGDCREIIPSLDRPDAIIADPPYSETSLDWDSWPTGWPEACARISSSLWCFGSLRMFMVFRAEFGNWRLSQDVVWEKHNGSSSFNDRFRRVHEMAAHFYQGEWASIHKAPVYRNDATARTVRRKAKPAHWGEIGDSGYRSEDGGPRLERSVIFCRSCHGRAIHPTEKPIGIIRPLISYSVPAGGLVIDPFMGSGSTLAAAVESGRRAIGIEINEEFCEAAARRLSQPALNFADTIFSPELEKPMKT